MLNIKAIVITMFLINAGSEPLYAARSPPPNIVFIVADDLGWNDVGWHNDAVPTPHLNQLRHNNTVTLDNYYVQYVCTPSRAAFLTGIYPYHLGLQHYVIQSSQPNYVPGHVKLLPEYLKQLGYSTHAIGKWDLGFCRWDKTPTYRGFDTFYGFYNGKIDYFRDVVPPRLPNITEGLDFRDDKEVVYDQKGTYSAFSFTKRAQRIIDNHDSQNPFYMYIAYQNIHPPLQVPEQYLDTTIINKKRRYTTAMVKAMDEAIGNITESLMSKGILDDTIIVFTTDNGGKVNKGGNNWPLRGSKHTVWEGGTKGVGMIRYGGFAGNMNHEGLFHAVDWTPTLVEAAGGRTQNLDGVSQWRHLHNQTKARTEFLYNIDEIENMAGLRIGDYKLIVGTTGVHNGWYPPLNRITSQDGQHDLEIANKFGDLVLMTTSGKRPHYSSEDVLLYNLRNDPHEQMDVSDKFPEVVKAMYDRLQWYNTTRVPARFPPLVEAADPKYWNYTWSPGWC